MVDRPEFLYKIIAAYTENWMGILTQMEELGILDNELPALHCTPAYTSDLPKTPVGEKTPLKNVWFRSMAQMFSTVSPAMHEEFGPETGIDVRHVAPVFPVIRGFEQERELAVAILAGEHIHSGQ